MGEFGRKRGGPSLSAVRAQTYLWLAQRVSAAVLALAVVVHLATMIIAVRGGLSAAEILGRTRGSIGWTLFYGIFVFAVAVHAPIGLRAILAEWAGLKGRAIDLVLALIALALLTSGLRAVYAVTRP